jgi:hypothetical protein
MESHPEIGVCGSFIETFGNDNTVWEYEETDDFIRPSVFYKSMIGHASAIFRVSVLNENKVFYSERHIHMEDKVLWFSLLNITKFHNIQEVLYKYRILDHNITIINKSTLEERVAKYYYEVFTHFGIDFTPSILKIHMGYSNFSEFSRLELVHYFQWLNILIEKARLEKFSSHASLKYHLHLMSTRMVQKAISGKNTSILLVTLQNHSWIEKVPIFFRFALNRTKIYLRAIIRKKAIR